MLGDLHSHTTYSDAALDVHELPPLAKAAGLTHLAISDHDSEKSVRFAYEHPQCNGVTLVPATELTAQDKETNRRVHILCYYPQLAPALTQFCAEMAHRRNEANHKSLAMLQEMYPQFSAQKALEYAAPSGVLFKTHLIRVLYDYAYTPDIYGELYRKLFGREGTVLQRVEYESVETVLDVIHQAHGVAVLAHPSVYRSMELAAELAKRHAIDGVEIEHPRNRTEDKQVLRALAKEYGLVSTGGTDFHGMYSQAPLPLGTCTTDETNICRLAQLAEQRR